MTTQYETLRHEDTYREAFGAPAALGERLLWLRKAWLLHRAPGGGHGAAVAEPSAPATGTRCTAGGRVEGNAADDTAAQLSRPHPRAGACAMGAGAALGQVSV